ncbi:MAG: hypothetical protein M2R45_01817 [Verrucomicrobia subdivision 3 bacterium]|nr:hypothetical protein [Limisphaerales bacterium]MCS1415828.1 hypothetical protein [Limisphaerales bacterium]
MGIKVLRNVFTEPKSIVSRIGGVLQFFGEAKQSCLSKSGQLSIAFGCWGLVLRSLFGVG